jgi:hypothetical protein
MYVTELRYFVLAYDVRQCCKTAADVCGSSCHDTAVLTSYECCQHRLKFVLFCIWWLLQHGMPCF